MLLQTLVGKFWRRTPVRLRRFAVGLTQPRFRVTVGAVVVDRDARRVLLLKHVLRWGSGWGIPGGFLERGEHPEDAVRRELREEAGLELEEARIVFARNLKKINQIEIMFLCRAAGGAAVAVAPHSLEIVDAKWFDVNALPADVGHDQRRLIERALTA